MAEEFLVRTLGGPHDGEVRLIPSGVMSWPPPTNLPGIFHGGMYVLIGHAKMLPMPTGKGFKQGAEYEWREEYRGP